MSFNTAWIVAPQITASGATLEWLGMYVNQHSAIGAWPMMREPENEADRIAR